MEAPARLAVGLLSKLRDQSESTLPVSNCTKAIKSEVESEFPKFFLQTPNTVSKAGPSSGCRAFAFFHTDRRQVLPARLRLRMLAGCLSLH
jgi:hypothetical protein